jgi:hypothetical protein
MVVIYCCCPKQHNNTTLINYCLFSKTTQQNHANIVLLFSKAT